MANEQLAPWAIPQLPTSFYYIPNFITPDEEAALLSKARWTQLTHRRLQVYPTKLTNANVLLAQPLPPWLSNPILPRFHELGIFTTGEEEGTNSQGDGATQNSSVPDPLPASNKASNKASTGTLHGAPNHVLINEYPAGQGIMPHEDGDAYAPVVATVSLGSHCVLDLYDKQSVAEDESHQIDPRDTRRPRHRILQEPRSLLVTRGPAYKALLHGIADVKPDSGLNRGQIANWDLLGDASSFESGEKERELRVSLTFRDVIKVSNVGSKLFGRR